MLALILFFLHKEPNNFEELAKYWKYIERLVKMEIISMAQIPMTFK